MQQRRRWYRRPGTAIGGLAIGAATLVAPSAAAEPTPPDWPTARIGVFSQNCNYSHSLSDDPILYPGVPGAAHHHDFFGNPGADADSTPRNLREEDPDDPADNSTCNRKDNRSAYWTPALYIDGEYQTPTRNRIYYRGGGIEPLTDIVPVRFGHRMIAGDAGRLVTEGDQDTRIVEWHCVREGREDDPAGSIPDTCPDREDYTGELRVRVTFPNCWDGRTDWPTDQSHMTYSFLDEDGNEEVTDPPSERFEQCPQGFVPVPAIQVGVRWYVGLGTDLTGAALSSDGHHRGRAVDGRTAHADFMNGWSQEVLEALIENCIHTGIDCADNEDGTG